MQTVIIKYATPDDLSVTHETSAMLFDDARFLGAYVEKEHKPAPFVIVDYRGPTDNELQYTFHNPDGLGIGDVALVRLTNGVIRVGRVVDTRQQATAVDGRSVRALPKGL